MWNKSSDGTEIDNIFTVLNDKIRNWGSQQVFQNLKFSYQLLKSLNIQFR